MRRSWLHAVLFGVLVAEASADTEVLSARALTFLAILDEREHRAATWRFDDDERFDVHYAPLRLDGVRHGSLSSDAYEAGEALLRAATSRAGFEKVQAIRLLERDVRLNEFPLLRFVGFRDPGRYYFALFGTPSAEAPWALRYEGHHLSLNITAVPGAPPASTPLFLGAQPRVVPQGMPSEGVAALGEEERLIRMLYASLDPEQRAQATLPYAKNRGHMIGQVSRVGAVEPIGLARAGMDAAQQELLDALLEQFAGFWSAEIASARRDDIALARESLHFAHVETDDPPHAFYTRVSGDGLLLEIDNTEGGDHVHAVWHQAGGDFGDDLLTRHLAAHHGHGIARNADRPADEH
jgi:hypothetical protein